MSLEPPPFGAWTTLDRISAGREEAAEWRLSDGTTAGTRLLRVFNDPYGPGGLVALDANRVLFTAGNAATGRDLWVADGSAFGTQPVRDIRPGTGSGLAGGTRIAIFNGAAYFAANDGVSGWELWTSQGTSATTRRVVDLQVGAGSSSPRDITWTIGYLWFTAWTSATGREIWTWDGRAARLVRDIVVGAGDASPRDLQSNGFSQVYFSANDGGNGRELWVATRTSASRATQINPGSGSSDPMHITMIGLTPWFTAYSPSRGREAWRIHGTTGQPLLVADLGPGAAGSDPRGMTMLGFGSPIVFGAHVGGDFGLYATVGGNRTSRIHPRGIVDPRAVVKLTATTMLYAARTDGRSELWKTDGTTAGTVKVKTLHDANGSSSPSRKVYHAGLDRFFFVADDGSHGSELWTSDGTATGTRMVRDIRTGAGHGNPRQLTEFGEHLLFFADDATGTALWQSDGTAAGTRIAARTGPGGALVTIGYAARGTQRVLVQTSSPDRLFRWTGTTLVAVTNLNVVAFRNIHLTAAGELAYFMQTSRSAPNTMELWRTDGTLRGTSLVRSLNAPTWVPWTRTAGSRLYFALDDGVRGAELWTSLGTAATTQMVLDLGPGASSSSPAEAVVHRDNLYFAATTETAGRELWRTAGSAASTVQVANIGVNALDSDPRDLVNVGDELFFSAWSAGKGRELWATRGTGTSTRMVRDIEPGIPGSNPTEIAPADSGRFVVFAAGEASSGYEVWVSDGTAAGTQQRVPLRPEVLGADPRGFTLAGSRIFYSAFDDATGRELYQLPVGAFGGAVAAPFGRGGPSSSGRPFVAADGLPRLGNAEFAIELRNAPPSSGGALWIALPTAPLPLGPSCTFHAAKAVLALPVKTDGKGGAKAAISIPAKGLLGAELIAQYGVVDAKGCFLGLANLSDALRVVVGR